MVRQLFELGIIQSGFWHQFALTTHSPIGKNPDAYGVTPHYKDISFANNDVDFSDQTGIDHSKFSYGLKKSLFNYMHGIGFDLELQDWFDFKIPTTTIAPFYIEDCLAEQPQFHMKPNAKIVWLGHEPLVETFTKTKKGFTNQLVSLQFHDKLERLDITLNEAEGLWLVNQLEALQPTNQKLITFAQLKADFETQFENFELFWFSKPMLELQEFGLLSV